jgi:hypothetical protein
MCECMSVYVCLCVCVCVCVCVWAQLPTGKRWLWKAREGTGEQGEPALNSIPHKVVPPKQGNICTVPVLYSQNPTPWRRAHLQTLLVAHFNRWGLSNMEPCSPPHTPPCPPHKTSHINTHTHYTLTHLYTLTHTHIHALRLIVHSYTHTFSHTHLHIYTHTQALILTQIHTCIHTHTLT